MVWTSAFFCYELKPHRAGYADSSLFKVEFTKSMVRRGLSRLPEFPWTVWDLFMWVLGLAVLMAWFWINNTLDKPYLLLFIENGFSKIHV